jgi:hypothetical protein
MPTVLRAIPEHHVFMLRQTSALHELAFETDKPSFGALWFPSEPGAVVAGLAKAEEFFLMVLSHPAGRDSHRYAAQTLAMLRFLTKRAESVAKRRYEDEAA